MAGWIKSLPKSLLWLSLAMLFMVAPVPSETLEAGPKRETRTEVKREAERKIEQRREIKREREQARERASTRAKVEARRETRGENRYEVRTPGREKSYTVARSKAKFASTARRDSHFRDHGRDFASPSAKAYEQRAAQFMGGRTRAGVWQGTRPESRDVVRYDPKTREFGVISRDGKIRTYYRLSQNKNGERYFENAWRNEPRQNGRK